LSSEIAATDREVVLGDGLPPIPERLLLAQARGQVLFICGAGISRPAGLPDFRELVLDVYESLDTAVHSVLTSLPEAACNQWQADCTGLTSRQAAEINRFILGDYDVVLGMLERRLDDRARNDSPVRQEVANRLRSGSSGPSAMHKALIRLADRGGARTIVTTNFDLLLEIAAQRLRSRTETYSLGAIPRPSRQSDFSGVLHIHGALDKKPERASDLVLTDQDFGEFYLRRRTVPDFIYDAARLFHLVLVGYSANDPPMRYLLNAVAADGTRFDDLKERFTFTGTNSPDPVPLEDWKGRGITPIQYDASGGHDILRVTLERWAELSAINGKQQAVDATLRRIVKVSRTQAPETDRDLFDHLVRRSSPNERARLSSLISENKADLNWLDAIISIGAEKERGW
jgi:hypothetical protein